MVWGVGGVRAGPPSGDGRGAGKGEGKRGESEERGGPSRVTPGELPPPPCRTPSPAKPARMCGPVAVLGVGGGGGGDVWGRGGVEAATRGCLTRRCWLCPVGKGKGGEAEGAF